MSFKIKANFIVVFKIGDNINFNLRILKTLYDGYNNLPDGRNLIKPIVILNTAVTEAVLYDFVVNRLKRPYSVDVLFIDIFNFLKDKDLRKFEHYITQAEKFDLFDLKDTNFYNALRSLNKKRNRVHIQNDRWEKPYEEYKIFDEKAKILSEKVLEKVVNTMTLKYPRNEEYHDYVNDFELPWNRHFDSVTPSDSLTLEEAQDLGVI